MEFSRHIEIITAQCNAIEQDSHLEHSPDGFVALNELRIAVAKLKLAAPQRNGQKERGQ